MTSIATDTVPELNPASDTETSYPAPGQAGTLADPATAALERPGSLPTPAEARVAAKDKVLTSPAAVDLAHAALAQITDPLSVGAHAGARSEGDRLVTHLFDCNLSGYRGWRWAVTLTRPPRARSATICEMELLPGEDALLAPAWIPWADRLQPGDVSRSDRLPRRETDERLEPGWEATGDDEGDVVGTDALDFGRARVLSAEGVQRAAQRWYDGDHGPDAEGVRRAHAACGSCGFFMPVSGPLRNVFGICANEWAADDGRVVSLDHGCGAHSETDVPDQGPEWPVTPSRLDELAMEPLGSDGQSIRDGRTQTEENAAVDAQSDDDEGAGGDSAGDATDADEAASAPAARARRTTKSERTTSTRTRRAGTRQAGEDAQGRATGASRRRSSVRRRSVASAAQPDVAAKDAPASAQAATNVTGTGESTADDRHASALSAVAELTAGVSSAAQAHVSRDGAPSLADLEATLPFGH